MDLCPKYVVLTLTNFKLHAAKKLLVAAVLTWKTHRLFTKACLICNLAKLLDSKDCHTGMVCTNKLASYPGWTQEATCITKRPNELQLEKNQSTHPAGIHPKVQPRRVEQAVNVASLHTHQMTTNCGRVTSYI